MNPDDPADRVARWRSFHASADPALRIVVLPVWGRALPSLPRLADFNHRDRAEHQRYLAEFAEAQLQIVRAAPALPDDYIPTFLHFLGQSTFSIFVKDRPVRFIDNTSWTDPCIQTWDDLDALVLDEDNYWFRLHVEGLAYLKERLEGEVFIAMPNDYGPMDLANALRGDALFLDFYDSPDEVHRLMDFCTRAIIWRRDAEARYTSDVCGGSVTQQRYWLPGKPGVLSVDASIMTSPEMFVEFEKPYIERIIAHAGGSGLHTHSVGAHQLRNYASLAHLRCLQIGDDPNSRAPIDELEGVLEDVGTMPVCMLARPQQIRERMEPLKRGRFILLCPAAEPGEAYRIIEFVRQHSSR